MSKKLIVSPAAGGKTAYAVALARQSASLLQAEVRVCVPTSLQARAWRDRLADDGGAIGVHVFTFDGLGAACLNVAGESYTPLSEPVQYRLLKAVIEQLPLKQYAPLKAKPGFIQVAQQTIAELKSALIFPLEFRQAIVNLGNELRLRELADIYEAYQAQLQEQDWADRVGLQWLAVEALRDRAVDSCREWPLLIVDGFDNFTPTQMALLQLLADRVDDCLITLPQATFVDYPRYASTRQNIEEALGVKAETLPDLPSGEALFRDLSGHLFALSTTHSLPANESITLREAPDRTAEVRTALRWLKQRIVWDKVSADQTALLARETAPYRSYIQQIAKEFGLRIRLVNGRPLLQSPIITALMELLRLQLPMAPDGGPDLSRRQVISAWRSPYFRWNNGELAITPVDADALDKLARAQRVIRGLDQWQAAFSVIPLNKEENLADEGERHDLDETIVRQLPEKFDYFLAVTQPPAAARRMREFVGWLERMIGPDPEEPGSKTVPQGSLQIVAQARNNPETAEADVAALRALKDILRGLVWAEESVPQTAAVNFISFFDELSGAILATRFMLPAHGAQSEILLANVTQVRGLSFDSVAVMGLSEGSFPATIGEDPFLRDIDRERLRQEFNMLLQPSTQSAEREFFYEAITRPRRKLLLTRPVLAENGAEWVASPFWEAVQKLSSSVPELIASEAMPPLAETASWAEWWETTAGCANGAALAEERSSATWQRILTAVEIWQARLAADSSIWDGDLRAVSAELTVEHGPDTVFSASRLETYQTCGFLFYLQYVLKLAPRPEPAEGLDARQLGSIYHKIFEQVTRVEGLDPANEPEVRKAVTAVSTPILDAAPEKEGFRETPWWAQTRQEITDNVIVSVMALGAEEYKFFRSEMSFGIKNTPLIIREGSDKLQLRGFIDRVDRSSDGRQFRIIDYKLGGPTAYTSPAFAEGKKLQLPLYALAVQEALGLAPVADGFYWHYQRAESSSFHLAKAAGGVAGAIETAVTHAWEAVHQIRDGHFTPRPPDGGCPAYCPAANFCWQFAPRNY